METRDSLVPRQDPFVIEGIGRVAFRNPSTGEVIDTVAKYDSDVRGMTERAQAERAAGVEPVTIDEALAGL